MAVAVSSTSVALNLHPSLGLKPRGRHCTALTRQHRSPRLKYAERFIVRASLSDANEAEMGNVKLITSSEEFYDAINGAGDRLVVMDISTKTCGPCRFIFPKVVQLSLEYPDIVFLKINGDHSADTRALMREWGVRAVPNFRFFRNGQLIHSHTGAKEHDLRENVAKFAAAQLADV